MARPAVFLDRDGTLLVERSYLRSVREMRLVRRGAEAVRRLNKAGLAVVVATNQSGIARGLLREDDLQAMHRELGRRLARGGARLDGIYYCPHHPEAPLPQYRRRCSCRKPSPGMLRRAARDLGLDLGRSYAIGDSLRDLEAGRRAGCRTVLVRTGYGREVAGDAAGDLVDHTAANLPSAVTWVLGQAARRARPRCRRP